MEAPHPAEKDPRSLTRVEKALALVDRDGLGLEIGPSHSPLAPRSQGFKVEVLDYLDADGLREKFGTMPVDIGRIEDVDYVWNGEPLRELVGGPSRYDWIIASHVIEHVPDLLGFLLDCREILKPDGVLSLVVPDKRYCFDHFRALTTTGEVLDAFEERRVRPTPGRVFDAIADGVDLDERTSWSVDSADGAFRSLYSFDHARHCWEQAKQRYEDAHVWCFTPTSFRLILEDVAALGLLNFDVVLEYDTAGNEFFVALGRGAGDAPGPGRLARLARLEKIEREVGLTTCAAVTATDETAPDRSTPPMALTPREESMVVLKRRVIGGLRSVFRR